MRLEYGDKWLTGNYNPDGELMWENWGFLLYVAGNHPKVIALDLSRYIFL